MSEFGYVIWEAWERSLSSATTASIRSDASQWVESSRSFCFWGGGGGGGGGGVEEGEEEGGVCQTQKPEKLGLFPFNLALGGVILMANS